MLLDAEDVARCSVVCRRWRDICNYDRVWLKLCVKYGIDVKEVSANIKEATGN